MVFYLDETLYSSIPNFTQYFVDFVQPDDRHYLIDENGETYKTSSYLWGAWFENSTVDDRTVNYTEITDSAFVSTVFLGLDHGWRGKVKIFETMYFDGQDWTKQRRYATLEEAFVGHQEMLEEIWKERGEIP